MVLTRARDAVAALLVPDEQSWTVWGDDPAAAGFRPVLDLGAARAVVVPERVPQVLAGPLAEVLAAAGGARLEPRPSPFEEGEDSLLLGRPAEEPGGHGKHDGHGEHEGHGHGHGDMMAIVGEPSADGLVMEPIEMTLGPLASPLPGGLVVEATLDGDVVAEAALHALLEGGPQLPDLLAPAAWRAATDAARGGSVAPEDGWRRIAAVERERAVSHLAWLRAFGRLLGWEPLVRRTSRALVDVTPDAAGRVVDLVTGSRGLAFRAGGRAVVGAGDARARGLRGPVARAAGIPDDARALDPRYVALGFLPLVEDDGDALARTRLRAREAVQALELASAAERMAERREVPEAQPAPRTAAVVEGPRGPHRAEPHDRGLRLTAPGSTAARTAAAGAMVGEEWAGALVAVASFDLSPWSVGDE